MRRIQYPEDRDFSMELAEAPHMLILIKTTSAIISKMEHREVQEVRGMLISEDADADLVRDTVGVRMEKYLQLAADKYRDEAETLQMQIKMEFATILKQLQKSNIIFQFLIKQKLRGTLLFYIRTGGEIKVSNQQILVSVNVNNIFDTKYIDHLSTLKEVGLYNPGRNITLNLKIPFSFKRKANIIDAS